MTQIRSFAAVRYNLDHVRSIDEVIAPVTDAFNERLQDTLYKRHPANVIRIVSNRAELGDDPGDALRRAGKFMRHWASEGVTIADPKPAIYVLRQTIQDVDRVGLIVRLNLDSQFKGLPERSSKESCERLYVTRHHVTPVLVVCPELNLGSLVSQHTDSEPIVKSQAWSDPFGLWRITSPAVIQEIADVLQSVQVQLPPDDKELAELQAENLAAAFAYQKRIAQANGDLAAGDPANYVMAMIATDQATAPNVISGLLFNPL